LRYATGQTNRHTDTMTTILLTPTAEEVNAFLSGPKVVTSDDIKKYINSFGLFWEELVAGSKQVQEGN